MDPNAAGTWAGVIVALVVGIGGLIVGIVGLNQAKHARSSAAEANRIANVANGIAEKANSLAREANEISSRAAERAVEQHDVDWDCTWHDVGMYAVTNNGRDTAFDVRIVITVDDELEHAEVTQVAPGQRILLEMPRAAEAWRAEKAERDARASRRPAGAFGSFPTFEMPEISSHFIRERILWRTGAGSPRVHDQTSTFSPIGPE